MSGEQFEGCDGAESMGMELCLSLDPEALTARLKIIRVRVPPSARSEGVLDRRLRLDARKDSKGSGVFILDRRSTSPKVKTEGHLASGRTPVEATSSSRTEGRHRRRQDRRALPRDHSGTAHEVAWDRRAEPEEMGRSRTKGPKEQGV